MNQKIRITLIVTVIMAAVVGILYYLYGIRGQGAMMDGTLVTKIFPVGGMLWR